MGEQRISKKSNLIFIYLSIITALLFLLLLVILHFIKPEMNPSWRMISEYEIGNYGWIMHVAFLFFAISTFSLYLNLRSSMNKIIGKIGNILILIICVGIIMGALFKSGSIDTPRNEMNNIAVLHNIGGFLAIFFIPFASLFISLNNFQKTKNIIYKYFIIIVISAIWISFLIRLLIFSIDYNAQNG